MLLHGFFRSSASFRVRIALNLKNIDYTTRSYALREGEQRSAAFIAINAQGLVPALELEDGTVLTQSLAICEYLDEIAAPPILPADAIEKAKVRAFAQAIACDIHPIQNLKILKRLKRFGVDEGGTAEWARMTIAEGFDACERMIADRTGPYCFGDRATLADICLIPQLANARRFGMDLCWPRLVAVEAACMKLDAFVRAAPENQPDAISA